ncbi:flavin reductase family protein [Nocardia sp. NPDC052278]|uniref:flavin reductase family protein n=1 Tax=unclassified Nocardia TaxID=2637762 RepID=UPI0036BF5623
MRPCELDLPGLPDTAARLACELVNVVDGGDHSILTGRVRSIYVSNRMPLVYWRRCSISRPRSPRWRALRSAPH